MCNINTPIWLSFSELDFSAGFDCHGLGDIDRFEEVLEDVIVPFLPSQMLLFSLCLCL